MKSSGLLVLGFMGVCSIMYGQSSDSLISKSVIVEVHDAEDSLEYEVVIFDAGYTIWLNTQAKPKEFYSLSYLKNWNSQYVLEWNNRFRTGQHSSVIESFIDYNPTTEYGLEVNYKLYTYFIYVEQELKIKLLHRANH